MSCALCELIRDPRGLGAGGRSVYEDEVATVLVEGAAHRSRALVIPKAHYRGLSELDTRTGQHLLKLGKRAALSLGTPEGEAFEVALDDDTAHAEPHVHVRVSRTRAAST